MQSDSAAVALVLHLDAKAEKIAELAFQRLDVGIASPRGVARACSSDIDPGPGRTLL